MISRYEADQLNRAPVCSACDGNGRGSYEMARRRCVETGGKRVPLPNGDWYYETGDGKEIEFKTVGGICSKCFGLGRAPG